MKTKKSAILVVLLSLGILLLVNVLGDSLFFRLDFTEDQRYTLSHATKDILDDLDEPVTVSAYFSEDLKPEIGLVKEEFKNLLEEYRSHTGGMVDFEFINPGEDEELEKDAMKQGVQPVVIQTREKDQNVQQKAFLGAVIKFGDQSAVLPVIQPGAPIEYDLTSAIKKLTTIDKPKIAFAQGHGEPSLQALIEVQQELSVLYDVQALSLKGIMDIPADIKTLAMVAPTDSLSPLELSLLDKFLGRGGNLLLCMDRVSADFKTGMGSSQGIGIETWLASKGVQLKDNFVVDAKCGAIGVSQPGSFFPMQVSFPYFPILTNFADHPISKGLEQMSLNFVSEVGFSGDTSQFDFTPLIATSEKSGTQQAPVFFDINKKWTDVDFPLQSVPVAAAIRGPFKEGVTSGIVVISNGSFAINGEGQQARQQAPDNISLMVNSIDWLSDDTGLIDLRTRGVNSRPIDELEDGTRATLKYLNFFLPILLAILYGLLRLQIRRRARTKLLEQSA